MQEIDFFGLKFSVFTKDILKKYINNTIIKDDKKVFYGYSLGIIPLFKKFPELSNYFKVVDVSVVDGEYMYWLLRLLRYKVGYKLSIPNLVNFVLDEANTNGYSIMLLGAKEEIKQGAENNISIKYPNIILKIGKNGYFDYDNEPDIVNYINEQNPDILLIGITSPKKERITFEWKDRLNTRIIIPCGGMIDVLSGKTKLSPPIIKKLGLATLYRMIQEPKRLFVSSILSASEILFKIIPIILYNYLLNKKDFKISEIYNK